MNIADVIGNFGAAVLQPEGGATAKRCGKTVPNSKLRSYHDVLKWNRFLEAAGLLAEVALIIAIVAVGAHA